MVQKPLSVRNSRDQTCRMAASMRSRSPPRTGGRGLLVASDGCSSVASGCPRGEGASTGAQLAHNTASAAGSQQRYFMRLMGVSLRNNECRMMNDEWKKDSSCLPFIIHHSAFIIHDFRVSPGLPLRRGGWVVGWLGGSESAAPPTNSLTTEPPNHPRSPRATRPVSGRT